MDIAINRYILNKNSFQTDARIKAVNRVYIPIPSIPTNIPKCTNTSIAANIILYTIRENIYMHDTYIDVFRRTGTESLVCSQHPKLLQVTLTRLY